MNDDLSDEAAKNMAKAMFCESEADFVGGWQECRAIAEAKLAKLEKEIDLLNKLLAVILSACESYITSKASEHPDV